MTKFMDGKEITFRQHILDIKYFAEMVDDLDGILKPELTLLDESLCRVDSNRDAFAVISCFLSKRFNILEFANCVCQELLLVGVIGREYVGRHNWSSLEFDAFEIIACSAFAFLGPVCIWLFRLDGHIAQCGQFGGNDQSRGKGGFKGRFIEAVISQYRWALYQGIIRRASQAYCQQCN